MILKIGRLSGQYKIKNTANASSFAKSLILSDKAG